MTFAHRLMGWRTALQIVLWRYGWTWPIALLLAALAMALHFAVFVPMRAELAAARAELAAESTALRRPAAPPPPTEQQRLEALQGLLRGSPPVGELVRTMATLAKTERIALQQSDYQQQFHGATHVVQVHITQPVDAGYPQLRRYIESVLRAIPNASLDQIAVRRENVGQAQLQARLRWSIWTQLGPGPNAPPARPGPREEVQ